MRRVIGLLASKEDSDQFDFGIDLSAWDLLSLRHGSLTTGLYT